MSVALDSIAFRRETVCARACFPLTIDCIFTIAAALSSSLIAPLTAPASAAFLSSPCSSPTPSPSSAAVSVAVFSHSLRTALYRVSNASAVATSANCTAISSERYGAAWPPSRTFALTTRATS